MASMTGSRILLGLLLLAGVALSGCGRKAALDTPYEAAVQAREDAAEAGQPVPPEPEPPQADRPFILDRLL
jgi:predicted small lipoprotein YifL